MAGKKHHKTLLGVAIAAALASLPAGMGIAALSVVIDQSATYPAGCNAQIFPDGKFRSDDGRPSNITEGECKDWLIDQSVADALIAQVKQAPILYDYDHNSIYGDTEASGWIVDLVYVPGRGIFVKVEWTPEGQEAVIGKAYRYSSPYFLFEVTTGKVVKLLSVALTNNPALGDLGGVGLSKDFHAAGSKPGDNPEEPSMELQQQVTALTTKCDTLTAALNAKSEELRTAMEKVATLEQDKAAAALAADEKAKSELIATATSGDKPLMTPAQAEAVKGLSLADLQKFVDTLKPVPLTQRQTDGKGGDGDHGLTAEESAMCERMGVTPEQFKAAQK